ncbi:MAG: antitoxin component YwqK of YwqJK toxin-antitoxin module [Rhodothermales bacterium]|jgi:antitoxin component YwqK of YwqJK toxin-antitoxin module
MPKSKLSYRMLGARPQLWLSALLILGIAEFAAAQSTRSKGPAKPSGVTSANNRTPKLERRKETHRNGVVKRYFSFYRDNATHRPMMHGYDTHYYNTGRMHVKLTYRHGRKDGKGMSWYANGQTKESGYYKANEKHAEWQEWSDTGTLTREITFEDGKRHGPYRHYWPDGKVRYEGNYSTGDRHGIFTRWFQNNSKESVVTFKNNEEAGVAKYYYDIGKQRAEYIYRNGLFEGEGRTWSAKGNLLAVGLYRADKAWSGTFWEVGPAESYYLITRYAGGEAIDSILYEAGDPMNGAIVEWHGEQRIRRCHYKDGRKNGDEVRWSPAGAIQSECEWVDNRIHGVYIEYNELSGKETWVVHCKNGVKDGPEWMWDEQGNLIVDGMNKRGEPWAGVLMVEDIIELEEAQPGKMKGSGNVIGNINQTRTTRTAGQVLKLFKDGVLQKIVTDEYFLSAGSERPVQHVGESGNVSKGTPRTRDGKLHPEAHPDARPQPPRGPAAVTTPTGPTEHRDENGRIWRTEITPKRR